MYMALYRKWRPNTFDEVVGQRHITDTLKKQVATGRLSHAYLFTGTRGTGKTSCAKILAKAVNCHNPIDGNCCNACPSCLGISDGSVMDVVEMDAASNNGVDNVRALRDEAIFSPVSSKKRVYIVDEVHMLSGSAFNALLKILEEPPEHLMFILATTELHKVPATILSRCQRHSFKRLDSQSIENRLKFISQNEGINLSDDAASLITRLSDGGMRDAISLLDQCSAAEEITVESIYSSLGLAGRQNTAQLLDFIAVHDAANALVLFDDLWKNGKDPAALLDELSSLFRDILIHIVAPNNGSLLQSGGYDTSVLERFSNAFSTSFLISGLETIQKALSDMRNDRAKTVCELCLVKLCKTESGANSETEKLPEISKSVSPHHAPAAEAVAKPEPPATIAMTQANPAPDAPIAAVVENPAPTLPDPADIPFDIPKAEPVPAKPVTVDAEREQPEIRHEAARSEQNGQWQKVKDAMRGNIPLGIAAILTDEMQVSANIDGNTLYLVLKSDFAKNQVGKPDVVARLNTIATQALGRQIGVAFSEEDRQGSVKAEDKSKKLDSLSRFDIVTFVD